MIHHREKEEVRRFDIFKLIVLLILIALLLWFWLSPPAFVQGPDDSGDTAVATTTDTDGDEEMDEEVREPNVPELESPVLTNGLEAGSTPLNGSAMPGSTVRIMVDGQEMGTTEAAADGSWSFDLDLEAGSRTLSLETLDADGNVDTTADFPAFDVAAPAVSLDTPSLDDLAGDVLGGPLTLSGRGTPGSTVGVWIDGVEVGTVEVGADGNWSFDTDLAAGDHDVRLQAIDLDGNVANESEGFGFSLGALTLPAFDLPSFDFSAGDLDFSGVGTPGSTVELVANGEVVGTAVVADDGTWTLPANLDAGNYDLSLRMLDANGNLLAESEGRSVSIAAADDDAAEFVLPTFTAPIADIAGGDII
ncbi:hypothetical protein MNBD_CHLOROFLEXI01-188, partial [hydrothermal vent metagenome]